MKPVILLLIAASLFAFPWVRGKSARHGGPSSEQGQPLGLPSGSLHSREGAQAPNADCFVFLSIYLSHLFSQDTHCFTEKEPLNIYHDSAVHCFFLKFISFQLKNNCFAISYWFLPYINMNQPEEYLCLLPLSLPPTRHPIPAPPPPGCHRAAV